jgi:hypothetical protein
VIACKTVVSPETTASAQASFSGVRFVHANGVYMFFDSRNGEKATGTRTLPHSSLAGAATAHRPCWRKAWRRGGSKF